MYTFLIRICLSDKATLSLVNVEALPDKGERLKTQVKELEDALDSLSLTAPSGKSTCFYNSVVVTRLGLCNVAGVKLLSQH